MAIPTKKSDDDKAEKFSEGFLKYKKATGAPSSDISMVLNCHLVVEYYLEQIILNSLPRGDVLLDEGRLNFATKLYVVKALDVLNDPLITAIQHLNKIRNLASHEMDLVITEANIDYIGRPFGKQHTELKKKHPTAPLKYVLMKIIARLEGSLLAIVENNEKKNK